MDRSLTKNTKNETKRNVDGTIGKITKENGTTQVKALVLEQNRTISKKSERAQPQRQVSLHTFLTLIFVLFQDISLTFLEWSEKELSICQSKLLLIFSTIQTKFLTCEYMMLFNNNVSNFFNAIKFQNLVNCILI